MSEGPDDNKPSRSRAVEEVEGLVDDAFGVDFKVPRTLWDLLRTPGRVYDAAAAGDHSRYTRPVRLLLALVAVQTLLFGVMGMADFQTFAVRFADDPAAMAAVEQRLEGVGSSVAEADELIRTWIRWTNWPITVLATLILVIVIWLMRRRLGLLRSFLLYVTASNASSIIAIPLTLAASLLGVVALSAAGMASFAVFAVYVGVLMHRRAADTATGLAARIAGVAATIVPISIAVVALTFLTLQIALKMELGVSWIELIVAGEATEFTS